MLDRRTFLLRAGATAALLAIVGRVQSAHAEATAAESAEFKATLEALLGKSTPSETALTLDLPESVENGDYVPVALSVVSPMTADNHVKAIHLLSTANPRAAVATFRFTLLSGKARGYKPHAPCQDARRRRRRRAERRHASSSRAARST